MAGRQPPGRVGAGWDIIRESEGWYLRRMTAGGDWEQVSGPYKQRGSALSKYRRMEYARLFGTHGAIGVLSYGTTSETDADGARTVSPDS